MGRDDPFARAKVRAAAARERGLAPPGLVPQMLPGAVFLVPDEHVSLPESRVGHRKRKLHEDRRVIIVQSRLLSASASPVSISAVPCSASSVPGPADLEFEPEAGEGFDKPKIVAFASLVQPFLKSDLIRHMGQLRDDRLMKLQDLLLELLGIRSGSHIAIPARASAPAARSKRGAT